MLSPGTGLYASTHAISLGPHDDHSSQHSRYRAVSKSRASAAPPPRGVTSPAPSPELQLPCLGPHLTPHSCLHGWNTCLLTWEQPLKHTYRLALKSSQKYSTETVDTTRVLNVSSVIWRDFISSSHSIYKFNAIPIKLPMAFSQNQNNNNKKSQNLLRTHKRH